jgi:hypothetical protein
MERHQLTPAVSVPSASIVKSALKLVACEAPVDRIRCKEKENFAVTMRSAP